MLPPLAPADAVMLLPSRRRITPPEISSIIPASAIADDVEILLPCPSFTEPAVLMRTLPADPLPVFALETELSESILKVPRVKLTEPAPAEVKEMAEMLPPFCMRRLLALTPTSPPFPVPPAASAEMPVKQFEPAPSIKSELAATLTFP